GLPGGSIEGFGGLSGNSIGTSGELPAISIRAFGGLPGGSIESHDELPSGSIGAFGGLPDGSIGAFGGLPGGPVGSLGWLPGGSIRSFGGLPGGSSGLSGKMKTPYFLASSRSIVYYYNAKTRKPTWKKPENCRIIKQSAYTQPSTASVPAVQSVPSMPIPPIGMPAMYPGAIPMFAPTWPQMRPMISETDIQRRVYFNQINPDLRDKAFEWQEYKTPDQRLYYFNTKTQERTWNKPAALTELDELIAKLQAEKAEKARLEAKARADAKAQEEEEAKQKKNESPQDKPDTTSGKSQDSIDDGTQLGKSKVSEADEQMAKDKRKPIATTAVPGSPWCIVWTGDNRVFYYNPSTKKSVWERPNELVGRDDVTSSDKDETPDSSLKPDDKPPSQPIIVAKKKVEVSEVEAKAAKMREEIPLEERKTMFRTMLIEKEVSAQSTFEKELHKIVFDSRYLLLTSRERRQVFDDYCREKIEQERRDKRGNAKSSRDGFKELLHDARLSSRSTFEEFIQIHCRDPRFRALKSGQERQHLFEDHVAMLRRKGRPDVKKDFNNLLEENLSLLAKTKYEWSAFKSRIRHDDRYQAVGSRRLRKEIFKDFLRSHVGEHKTKVSAESRSDSDD
ncbi:Transcription elongation regulator 1, partial [Fragariocoptes setiger]